MIRGECMSDSAFQISIHGKENVATIKANYIIAPSKVNYFGMYVC